VAGQRYRETDETLAQKARQHLFDHDDAHKHGAADPQRGSRGGGIGKYKASPLFGKDLPSLPDDPGSAPKPPQISTADPNVRLDKGPEPFSWKASPSDLTTGAASGIAGAAHDYGTSKAVKAGDNLKNWTKELDIKALGRELPGFSRAGGLMGVVTAVPGGIIDYSEAKAAGFSTAEAVGHAVAREGAGTAAGLIAGGFASGVAADMMAGAAIGSVIPGAGTAVGLVAGALFGGVAAFIASKSVAGLLGG